MYFIFVNQEFFTKMYFHSYCGPCSASQPEEFSALLKGFWTPAIQQYFSFSHVHNVEQLKFKWIFLTVLEKWGYYSEFLPRLWDFEACELSEELEMNEIVMFPLADRFYDAFLSSANKPCVRTCSASELQTNWSKNKNTEQFSHLWSVLVFFTGTLQKMLFL